MTPDQIAIIDGLKNVQFPAGSQDDKFARAVMATARKNVQFELSAVQDTYLRDLAHRYRRMLPLDLVMQDGPKGFSTLQWMAPGLVEKGLIKNESWVPENATKAIELFPHKDMHNTATLMAALHPYALDYIRTAPVLVLVIGNGKVHIRKKEQEAICKTWLSKFGTGYKLRDVMASVGLAYSLRKISAAVLTCGALETIKTLSTLNKETLDNFLPPAERQAKWLNIIGMWQDHMRRRFNDRLRLLEWAVKNYHPRNINYDNGWTALLNDVGTIADYAGTMFDQGRFNLDWNLRTVARDCTAWHDELARANNEQKFFLENGMGWEDEIDFTPLPHSFETDGHTFTALRSGKALFDEGAAMRHCVASYAKNVIDGRSRIYAMAETKTGEKIATVEFSTTNSRARIVYDTEMAQEMNRANTYNEFGGKQYPPRWDLAQAKGLLNRAMESHEKTLIAKLAKQINYQDALWFHCNQDQIKFRLALVLNPGPNHLKKVA